MEIDTSSTHPNPLPNPLHRKIELQSPLDLTYLKSNTTASARQKLDLHFPPNASQPESSSTDPMRQRVQDLVSQFLDRTWSSAQQSISINGSDAHSLPPTNSRDVDGPKEEREGTDFEYEAYDPRLSSKVASLYGELEALTTQVSKLRRTAPGAAAEGYSKVLMEVLEEDQRVFEQRRKETQRKNEDENVLKLEPVRDGWHEDVAGVYERGLGELRRLGGHAGGEGEGNGSLTGLYPKAERARDAMMELE